MTSFTTSYPTRPRRFRRIVCASTLVALAWGATGTSAGAAPGPVLETPLVSAAFSGLRVGSQGIDVKELQQALLDAGITVRGGADGIFGPATRQAVLDFQTTQGLAATGEVDQVTAAALVGDSTTTSGGDLSAGATGSAVTTMQEQLIASGVYVAGGADGVFGAATTRALKQFQNWNGLQVTGTLNAATATKLAAASGSATPPASTDTTPQSTDNDYVGLATGATGTLVKDLQTALMAAGVVVPGGADGSFGPATQTALKGFQRVNSLSETGVLSAQGAEILGLGSDASTPAVTASPYLGLKIGASGSAVRDTQSALIAAGVTVRGGADGSFGNATKAALVEYQTALGLTASGEVTQATIDKLGLGSSSAPTPISTSADSTPSSSSSNDYVGLSLGSSGELVRELQVALQSTGLVVRGGADGSFGSATKSALVAFQSVNGIAQTGVVTAQGAKILGLGTGSVSITNPNSSVQMERFPVQGPCFYGDTWHDPRGNGRVHVGTDVIANEGNLLYAVVDGEITKQVWDQPGLLAGNGLRITQPNGTYFVYLHMMSFAPGIEVGTQVQAGDVIGYVGNTGSSATPHLHFEIHPNGGAAVNPYPYMKAIDDCSNTTAQHQSSFT